MVNLGDKVRDKITGIEGIATSRIEYMTGCTQFCLTIKAKKGADKYPESVYLDEDRLEVVEKAAVSFKVKTAGGPPVINKMDGGVRY